MGNNTCGFCGKDGVPETRETINTKENGLSLLSPDEVWICNSCLKRKSNNIIKR